MVQQVGKLSIKYKSSGICSHDDNAHIIWCMSINRKWEVHTQKLMHRVQHVIPQIVYVFCDNKKLS
jgi:hypothetical protein